VLSERGRTRIGTRASRYAWGLTAIALLTCCAGGGTRGRYEERLASRWRYEIKISDGLERLDAVVCFEGETPRELRAGKSEGAERLAYARWLGPGPKHRLSVERGRIQLDAKPHGCIGYGIKLHEGGSLGSAVRRVGRDLLASPNSWLWRPERRTSDASATLTLSLPPHVRALLPWPKRGSVYQLDAETFRFDSYAAFGSFTPVHTEQRGVAIEAALLDGELAIDGEAAGRWLRAAVELVWTSAGAFPARSLSAVIVPSGRSVDPVPFGMVARGGGASLVLMVGGQASERALLRDWVLPHELSHLFIPFLPREHAFLSEGLASYYQELLRARGGLFDERELWSRLARSLRDAARSESSGTLGEESARMHVSHRYRRVYWGGAAFWLLADVELRSASHGHASLDTLFARLRSEGANARVWRADELMARLDELAGLTLFSRALAEIGAQPFPDFEPTLRALGVREEGGRLELDDAAPLAELRRSMTTARVGR
jgi:hypothetical protein